MPDIRGALGTLAVTRPVFHSEADFQHALAWQLHRQALEARVRLEIRLGPEREYLDLLVATPAETALIELKYKTRRLETEVDGEAFRLQDHSAQDLGRYDFWKDVCRLERMRSHHYPGARAYAVLLTNDSAYWAEAAQGRVHCYADFQLQEGRQCQGEFRWGPSAGAGTTKGREAPLALQGCYTLAWGEYSTVSASRYGVFRLLVVEVGV
jgi:hypothetical protein